MQLKGNDMNGKEETTKYAISLNIEEIKLSKLQEIVILGKNSVCGKQGIMKCFDLLAPDKFVSFEITDNSAVDAIFVNKRILVKYPKEKLLEVLEKNVFPTVSEGELLTVDMKIIITHNLLQNK